jgi:hypothetical protein
MVLSADYHSWPIKDVSLLESEYNLILHKLLKKKTGLAVLI